MRPWEAGESSCRFNRTSCGQRGVRRKDHTCRRRLPLQHRAGTRTCWDRATPPCVIFCVMATPTQKNAKLQSKLQMASNLRGFPGGLTYWKPSQTRDLRISSKIVNLSVFLKGGLGSSFTVSFLLEIHVLKMASVGARGRASQHGTHGPQAHP